MIVEAIMKALEIILEQVARGVITLEEAKQLARESVTKLLDAEQMTDDKRAALHAEVDAIIGATAKKALTALAPDKTGLLGDDGGEL